MNIQPTVCEISSPAGDVYSSTINVCVGAVGIYPDGTELQSVMTDRQMDDGRSEGRYLCVCVV